MPDLYKAAGLSGIDEQLCAGWPYHGAVKVVQAYELSSKSDYELVGYPDIGHSQLSARPQNNGNYYVQVGNRRAGWDYFTLQAFEYGTTPPYGAITKGAETYRVASMLIGAGTWDVGLPLKTPLGRYLNFNVLAAVDGSKIIATSRPRLFTYTMTGITEDAHPAGVFDTTHSFIGCKSFYGQFTSTSSTAPTQYVPVADISNARFSCRVLDYKSDRVLIALTTGALSTAAGSNVDVLNGIANARNYRFNEVGYTSSSRYSVGVDIVCIYELVLTGETAEDATLTLIKSPQECEGVIARISPTSTTTTTDENSPVIGALKNVYNCSVSQSGAILDAYYSNLEDAADNPIIFVDYSVAHTFAGEHSGQYKGKLWQQRAEYNSTMSIAGVTKDYKQVTEHVFDMPPEWSPIMPGLGDPYVKITNKIWEDGVLVIDEQFTPKDYDFVVSPVSLENLSGRRAPFPGSDSRVGQYALGYGYASYKAVFNMRFYSMTLRNNGSGTCVLYGVIDSFGIHPELDNIKMVSDVSIISRSGVKTLPAFTDTVLYNDPRYTLTSGASTYRYHMYRGYIGGMLKGTVNHITDEYYALPIDYPMAYTCWL
ncbi:MAG: hypothetical protein RBR45_11685 [Pseudomonas sp.]|nr:hypothetical protein [Pseudomonas sp.]